MRKRSMALAAVAICSIGSVGWAGLIGDFEGALEGGWLVTGGTGEISTDWSSTGTSSLKVTPGGAGFAWALQFNDVATAEELSSTHFLQMDVYWDSSEWTDDGADGWARWDQASLNSDATGWTQTSDANITDSANPGAPGGWDPTNWGETHMRTLTYDFTGLGFDATGATWAQFNLSVNSGAIEGVGSFYIDNVQTVLIPEPGTLALLGLGALVIGLRRRRA